MNRRQVLKAPAALPAWARQLKRAAVEPPIPEVLPPRAGQRSGIAPWHMWGNTQTIQTAQTGGSGVASAPGIGQMLRINYRRPDTWHWILSGVLLEAPAAALPGSGAQIDLFWDLTIGIGRAAMVLEGIEHFRWDYNNPNPTPLGQAFRLTTSSFVGNRTESQQGIVHTTGLTSIDELVFQDAQLTSRLILTTTGNGFSAKVEASAQFAPKTHIRPEWHDKRYPGGEES